MMCHISKGDAPLEIHWEFNGLTLPKELGTYSKVSERSSVLVLPSVTHNQSGNYTCIAKNIAGTTSYTTGLKIIGNLGFTVRYLCLLLYAPFIRSLCFC